MYKVYFYNLEVKGKNYSGSVGIYKPSEEVYLELKSMMAERFKVKEEEISIRNLSLLGVEGR